MMPVPESGPSLLRSKTFATYGPPVALSLPDLAVSLWEQQRQTWPALTDGLAALQAARTRELTCDGIRFQLQFNPRRIVSNQARVDKESVANRACFLCLERLPALQQGIL
jgi:hypothetical protein